MPPDEQAGPLHASIPEDRLQRSHPREDSEFPVSMRTWGGVPVLEVWVLLVEALETVEVEQGTWVRGLGPSTGGPRNRGGSGGVPATGYRLPATGRVRMGKQTARHWGQGTTVRHRDKP